MVLANNKKIVEIFWRLIEKREFREVKIRTC